MVMIKLGAPLIDINGRYNGEIYRRDQCGIHWQAPPKQIDSEPSPPQRDRRAAFRRLIYIWLHKMTQLMRDLWWEWSYRHPCKNKKGETIYWTALNWFIHFNINRVIDGLPVLLWPPWGWG